jgi:hypothetical protein
MDIILDHSRRLAVLWWSWVFRSRTRRQGNIMRRNSLPDGSVFIDRSNDSTMDARCETGARLMALDHLKMASYVGGGLIIK